MIVKNVRAIHAVWEKARRSHKATVTQAREHTNTRGSQVVQDLEDMLAQIGGWDEEILETESRHIQGYVLEDGDCQKTIGLCNSMVAEIKVASKKANALKPLFKV